MPEIVLQPRLIAATATANAALAAGYHTPVDATSGNRTMTLPTPTNGGASISVEKVDVSSNTVTISGNIRGGASTITLKSQYQTLILEWFGTTWRPTADHRTSAAIDAATDAKIATQAATDAGAYETQTHASSTYVTSVSAATTYATVVTVTGTSSVVTRIQAAYDAGTRKFRLQGGGTAVIDSSLFFDSTSTRQSVTIEGDGSTVLQLAAGLATTAAYTPNSGLGFGIYVNTFRSALSGSVVTCTDGTRATGTGYPARPAMIIKNLILDGQSLTAGYVFGNTAVAKFEDCTWRNVTVGQSWRGYADGASIVGGQVLTPATGAWLIDQISNGDGVLIHNLKGEETGVWRASGCNGGQVTAGINGSFKFTNCRSIYIDQHHTEADRTWVDNIPMFDIDCSEVVLDGIFGYSGHTGNRYLIRVNDTAGEAHSDVEVRHPHAVNYLNTAPDSAKLADIYIAAMNSSSRLRVESPAGLVAVAGSPLYDRDGLLVQSADTNIQTALTAAGATLAATSWVLRKRSSWEVVAGGLLSGFRGARALTAPTITSVTSQAGVTATTTAGTTEYAVALLDADGNYTAASAATSTVTIAGAADLILASLTTTPATLILWKKAGTGVLATPDAYVTVPADGQLVRLYNTGAYVNGRAWIASSVPVPNTVAATNSTFDRLLLPSGQIIAMGNGSPEGKYGALTGALYLRADGDSFTSLYRKTTSGGNTGWRSPRDTPGTLLAWVNYRPAGATNTDTTSTTFADADATNLVISFTAPATGKVLVRLSCDASSVTTSSDYYWNLRDSGGDVTGSDGHVGFSTSPSRIAHEFIMSGLTNGTTYTWKWGVKASNASNAARLRYGGTNGPAVMSVTTAA